MTIPKKYFHDRIVLLLLSLSTFVALLGSTLILLRLDTGRADDYIVQFRSNLGLSAFKPGGASAIIAFVGFMGFVLIFNILLSMKAYHIRRHFTVAILALTLLLLIVATIVSYSLLDLR